jgi:hypothetical protein
MTSFFLANFVIRHLPRVVFFPTILILPLLFFYWKLSCCFFDFKIWLLLWIWFWCWSRQGFPSHSQGVYVADLLDGRLGDGERTKCISKWLSLLSSYQRYGRSFRFSVWNWLAFRGEEWAWCMSHSDESPHNLQEIFKCFCQCQYQFVFPGPFFIFMSLWQISESTNLEWEEGRFSQSYWSWSMVTGLATFEPAVMRNTMVGSM